MRQRVRQLLAGGNHQIRCGKGRGFRKASYIPLPQPSAARSPFLGASHSQCVQRRGELRSLLPTPFSCSSAPPNSLHGFQPDLPDDLPLGSPSKLTTVHCSLPTLSTESLPYLPDHQAAEATTPSGRGGGFRLDRRRWTVGRRELHR